MVIMATTSDRIKDMSKAQLLAFIEALGGAAAPAEEEPTPTVTADGFASVGFVVVGNGEVPSEGDVATVPTKASNEGTGKPATVRLIERIDANLFPDTKALGEHAWAFSYRRLKRGES